MPRTRKWLISAAKILALVLILAGSAFLGGKIGAFYKMHKLKSNVAFGLCGEEPGVSETVAVKDLLAYEGAYAATSSFFYKNAAGEEGLLTYQATLYAMDHGYSFFRMPALAADDKVIDYIYGAVYDQPLLEENCTVDFTGVVFRQFGESTRCQEIELPFITAEKTEKKRQAVEAAQAIVSAVPQGTEEEKARYLYNWVVENIRYSEDAEYNQKDPNYLYDALIQKVTNCDGFSNAYTLLMNLAGLECFNVSNGPPDGEDGHTWNILRLGEQYYQADATFEAGILKRTGENAYIFFARSAAAMGHDPYDERVQALTPACTATDRDGVDACVTTKIPTEAEKEQLRNARRTLEQGGKRVLIRCDAFAEISSDERLELVKEWMRSEVVGLRLITAGKKYIIIYRKN